MNHREYKRAAERHIRTCTVLSEKLDTISNTNYQNQLILNIYYVSGYVVECMLKYAVCEEKRWNSDVKSFNVDGYTYLKDLQTHNLQKLIELFREIDKTISNEQFVLDTIPNIEIKKLVYEWSVEYRYVGRVQAIALDKAKLLQYLGKIETFYNNFKNRY